MSCFKDVLKKVLSIKGWVKGDASRVGELMEELLYALMEQEECLEN